MTELNLYFEFRCLKGLYHLGLLDKPEYRERLEYEMEVIIQMGFPGYFLIVADLLDWCRQQEIRVGPGRGSVSGSMCAYSLGITHPALDPIRYGLLFERFLNPDRISMPDIDMDFDKDRRDEVIQYLQDKYGHDNVSHIGTYGTMKAKAAIREVTRVLGHPYSVGATLSKLTLPAIAGKEQSLETCYAQVPELKALKENSGTPEAHVLEWAEKLEGQKRSFGTHAGGIVLSEDPVYSRIPITLGKDKKPTTQFEMNNVEEVGLVKFDVLGLRGLTTIQTCLELIQEDIDIDDIPIEDGATFQRLQRGDTVGIFQLEGSSGIQDLVMQIKPANLEDLTAAVSIYRPGPLGCDYLKTYLAIRAGKAEPEYLIPELEPILGVTSNFLIFQEQILEIAKQLAGYTGGEADSLRKCVGGDTLIRTPDGLFPIRDLVGKNYKALTCSSFQHKYNNVKYTFKQREEKDTVKITTESGTELICTYDHKVFTNHGWVEASKLSRKHYLLHNIQEQYGTFEYPEHILFLLAAISTEGYFREETSSHFCNTNIHHIKEFSRSVKILTGEEPRTWQQENVHYVYIPKKAKVYLNNIGLKYSLSSDKELPKEVLQLSKRQTRKLLGLLIDFDGWVIEKQLEIGYSSKSKRLIHQVKYLFESLGVRAPIYVKQNHYSIIIRDQRDTKQVINCLLNCSEKCKIPHPVNKKNNFTKHIIPHNIWFPIVEKLIKQSGYKRHQILTEDIVSGTYFNSSLSKERLSKILSLCGRSKELEFYLQDLSFWDKIKTVKPNGKSEVFDFTMSSHITPCAYGNNLLIHNSVGKKLPKLMAEHETKFKGGVEKNGYSSEVADKLWNDIKDFAAYGFNKSHGLAYSYISYQMAYLKEHYTTEFLCACLISDSGDVDKIIRYVSWCKDNGIEILPPSINKSECNFSIEEGKIRFGLQCIKNVGASAKAIIRERKNGPFRDITDFYNRIDTGKLNKKKVESLIGAGSFDEFGLSRGEVYDRINSIWDHKAELKSYQSKLNTYNKRIDIYNQRQIEIEEWDKLTKEEKKQARKEGKKKPGKLKLPVEPEKPKIVEKGIRQELGELEKLSLERELIGCYLSGHPLDYISAGGTQIQEIKETGSNKQRYSSVAIPSHIKELTTKKKQRMAYVTLEDKTGTIQTVVLPPIFKKYGQLLDTKTPIRFSAEIEVIDNEDTRLVKLRILKVEEIEIEGIDPGIPTAIVPVGSNTPAKVKKIDQPTRIILSSGSHIWDLGIISEKQ